MSKANKMDLNKMIAKVGSAIITVTVFLFAVKCLKNNRRSCQAG